MESGYFLLFLTIVVCYLDRQWYLTIVISAIISCLSVMTYNRITFWQMVVGLWEGPRPSPRTAYLNSQPLDLSKDPVQTSVQTPMSKFGEGIGEIAETLHSTGMASQDPSMVIGGKVIGELSELLQSIAPLIGGSFPMPQVSALPPAPVADEVD